MNSREKTHAICYVIVYVISISLMNTSGYHSKWVKSWMWEKEKCIHAAVRVETKHLTTIAHHEYNPCVYLWRAGAKTMAKMPHTGLNGSRLMQHLHMHKVILADQD